MGKGLTVVLIERKEQYSTRHPPTLLQCGMGGGTMVIHIVRYVEKINLEGLMPIYGQIGNQIIVQTAAQRWTEATAIALWYEQEQMMDIGGMMTIFVAMGESRGKYIEN